MRKRKVTAAELMERLKGDPEYVARQARVEAERLDREAESRRAQALLVEDLRSVGLTVESVWELVNTAAPYPHAIPILLEHLQRPYPGPVREGIARALAVPQAKIGRKLLVDLYRSEHDTRAKDGLAVAIAAVTDDDDVGDLIALAGDPQNGPSRILLLRALKRSRDPRAASALRDLESDPDLTKEVRHLLGESPVAR